MADTLEVFGTTYENVSGFKAKDSNGNILTYTRGGGGGYVIQDQYGNIILPKEGDGGGGSSTNYGVAETYTFTELFYAIEHRTQVSGTFTPASQYPAGVEMALFDTGIVDNVSGIMIFDTENPADNNPNAGALMNNYGFFSAASTPGTDQPETTRGAWRNRSSTGAGLRLFGATGTNSASSGITSYRLNSGILYITSKSNGEFTPGHTYRWVAWPHVTE